jgi:hypothetical protein
MKKTMKKRRCGKAQANTTKRNEKNNLASIKIRNPMLTRRLPLDKTLLLDQTIINQLLQLILRNDQNRPGRSCGPHGEKLLVLNDLKNLIFIHLSDLLAAYCP